MLKVEQPFTGSNKQLQVVTRCLVVLCFCFASFCSFAGSLPSALANSFQQTNEYDFNFERTGLWIIEGERVVQFGKYRAGVMQGLWCSVDSVGQLVAIDLYHHGALAVRMSIGDGGSIIIDSLDESVSKEPVHDLLKLFQTGNDSDTSFDPWASDLRLIFDAGPSILISRPYNGLPTVSVLFLKPCNSSVVMNWRFSRTSGGYCPLEVYSMRDNELHGRFYGISGKTGWVSMSVDHRRGMVDGDLKIFDTESLELEVQFRYVRGQIVGDMPDMKKYGDQFQRQNKELKPKLEAYFPWSED